jgi:hypothetical protein
MPPVQVRIVSSFTALIESTGIPNFAHYRIHAPCEISDERNKAVPNSCSSTVRIIVRNIPRSSEGFTIVPDWNKYYKSIGREPPRNTTLTALVCRMERVGEPLSCEADLLRSLTSQWGREQELYLRLSESCLQSAGPNASAAILASADDLADLIDKGMDALDASEIQEDDRAHQMLRVPITSILSSDEAGILEICTSALALDVDADDDDYDRDEQSPYKLCHHFKTFLAMRSNWSSQLRAMCEMQSISIGDLYLLVCVQKHADEVSFDIPGGIRKLGEKSMDALLRKVKEESGLTLRDLGKSQHLSGEIKQISPIKMMLEETFACYLTYLYR